MTEETEGRYCYHCGIWIPYTIHANYWYCFSCGFYFDRTVPLDTYYEGHHHEWKIAELPNGRIAQFCADPTCTMEFTQSRQEYDRDQEKGRLRNFFNSREWVEEFRVLDQYKRGTPVSVRETVPIKSYDEATPQDLARFERFIQRRVDARERRHRRNQERRAGK